MSLIADTLALEGLGEYTDLLLGMGLDSIKDLADVSDQDLQDLGIDKIFHRRKLLKLGGHVFETGTSTRQKLLEQDNHHAENEGTQGEEDDENKATAAGRHLGGDKIVVEVLAARGNSGKLSEKEFYVKGALCTFHDKRVIPVGTGQKTTMSRGPFPVWGGETSGSETFIYETDFRAHCLSFEVKEKRMLGDNKVVGVVIFPPSFFHKFEADTVVDNWWPLRLGFEDEGEVQAYLRLKFTVPGGCPTGAKCGKIFHVKGVSMSKRKLRLTIFDAQLGSKNNACSLYGEGSVSKDSGGDEAKPNLYIQVQLDDEDKTVRRTATIEGTTSPAFDETFEFFMEVAQAKLVRIKLKEPRVLGSDILHGTLNLPIQFFLCQKETTDVDQVHALLAPETKGKDGSSIPAVQSGRVHVRLEVRSRVGMEKRISFSRTRSIKEDVTRAAPTLEEDLGTVMVDDGGDTTDDEDVKIL